MQSKVSPCRRLFCRLLFFPAIAILAIQPLRASVTAWGTNDFGELTVPTNLVIGAKSVAGGDWHVLAVTSNNAVAAWGLNDYGQTNVPAGLSNVIAVAGGQDHSLALLSTGSVVGWGINSNLNSGDPDYFGQADIPADLTNAIAISAGAFHSMALKANGTVKAWGYDFYGQCDVPANLTNVVAISCGGYFSLALKADGTVSAWGDDYYGQTDLPSDLTNVVAIAAGGLHGLALKADGTVEAWGAVGDYDFGQANVPANVTNAVAIAAGFYHSLALMSDGTLQQWGDTSQGQTFQTNRPTALTKPVQLAAGYADSYALDSDLPVIWTQPTSVATATNRAVAFLLEATGVLPLRMTWWQTNSPTNILFASVVITNFESLSATFKQGSVAGTNLTFNKGVMSSALNLAANDSRTTNVGTYGIFAVLSNSFGFATSSVVTLSVMVPPKITTQPVSIATNAGATVFLSPVVSGTPPLGYSWSLNGQVISFSSTTPVLELDDVSTNDAGVYQLYVTNAVGTATSAVVTLTVNGAPAIVSEPTNTTVNLGQNANFSVTAGGADPLAFQWYYYPTNTTQADAVALLTGTNSMLTVFAAQTNDAGNYFVIVTNSFGAATSTVATLSVQTPPIIVAQPTNVVTAVGHAAGIELNAIGLLPMRFTWYGNSASNSGLFNTVLLTNIGSVSAGFQGGSIAVTNEPYFTSIVFWLNLGSSDALVANPGNYRIYAVLSNSLGVVTSSVATLTVMLPPQITNQPVSVATNVGGTVFFNVGVSGSQPMNYQWLFNGQLLETTGQTNVLELDNVSLAEAGTYQLIVSNAVGTATSSVVDLSVNGAPIIWSQPTNQIVILNSNATFSPVVAGADPLNYQWYFYPSNTSAANAVYLPSGTNSTLNIQGVQTNNAGNYFLIVNNSLGSATSTVATLTVLTPPLILTQPTNQIVPTNHTADFLFTASGAIPMSATWWRNSTTNTKLATVTVTNYGNPGASFTGGAISISNYINFNGTLQVAMILTSSGPYLTNTGNYFFFCVLSNVAGTVTSSVANLTVLVPPKITNAPANIVTNLGVNVFLTAGVTGSPPLTYQWFFNGVLMSNLLSPTNVLELDNVTTSNQGSYQVVVSNGAGTANATGSLYLLANGSATPAKLWLLSHDPTNGDSLLMELESGRNYRVQSSINLSSWTNITNFLSPSPVFSFTNALQSNYPSMYYRVVSP